MYKKSFKIKRRILLKKIKIYILIILQTFVVFTIFYYGKEYYYNQKFEHEITTILNNTNFNHLDFYNNIYSKNFENLVIEVVKLVNEEEKNKDIINRINFYFELLIINRIALNELILKDNLKYEHKRFLIIQNNLINLLMKKIKLHQTSKD